jgi:hypothetical protein
VEFSPGSADLAKPAQDQLAAIKKALTERPQLKLDVPIVASDLDRTQLARQHLQEALAARASADTLADPAKRFKALVEQFHADVGKDATLPSSALAVQVAKKKDADSLNAANADIEAALIAHIQVADADLDALGRARASAIQNALLADGQVDPGRIFITNAALKPAAGDTVKVELGVHQ